MQDSFVGDFDQINESVKKSKNNMNDEDQLTKRINDVLKDNEGLRAKISLEKSNKKACQSCDDLICKLDKLTKALDKEKETYQSKLHASTLQKELQESKLKANASLLQHKLDLLS